MPNYKRQLRAYRKTLNEKLFVLLNQQNRGEKEKNDKKNEPKT